MVKLNYEYTNNDSKDVVVFLHGWGLSGEVFNDIISKLENNISVLKLDLYGFGKSSQPKKYFDTFEYAYQIFLLLKKLNINSVMFVGHSFGGRLSILLSSVFDINVKHCILTSSAGINRFSLIKWLKIKKYKIIKWLVKSKLISEKYLLNNGSVDYKNCSEVMKSVFVKVVNQDVRSYAKKIKCRCFLVWDKNDKETPFFICKKLSRLIIDSVIILFEFGGHFTAFRNSNKLSKIINKNINV